MKPALVIWGVILLAGFWASQQTMSMVGEANLWMGWAIVLVVGYYLLGKTVKKVPKESYDTWAIVMAFGFLTTFVVALGLTAVDFSFLMALWLVITGAALFAGSEKDQMAKSMALVYLFGGLLVPVAFSANYFIGGALFLGLYTLLHGLVCKK